MNSPTERLLRRPHRLTLAALAILVLLSWAWLAGGAGMGSASFGLGPGRAEPMAMDMANAWGTGRFAATLAMWWVMMVAMMVPAAAPTILLFSAATARSVERPPAAIFLSGYLLVWGLFSLAATLLQWALDSSGLLAMAWMGSTSPLLSAAILAAAGLYQLSLFKDKCLSRCRNPAAFLSRHYRPGRSGALRMGLIHGAWCVGCCWLLMALLFVGGVMNLLWIAGLTLFVAAEKLLPRGEWLARAAGVLFLLWAGAILLYP